MTAIVADTLSSTQRARILEAALRLRRMIFPDDTTSRLDGCSVAQEIGAEYRALLTLDVRKAVFESGAPCSDHATTGFDRRLVVESIRGGGRLAVIKITFVDGRSTHEEEFKVQKLSSRPDVRWSATEVRAYDALIVD